MPKSAHARKRRQPPRRPTLAKDPFAFPILMALVAGFIVFGALQYSLMVALGSAVVVGFFAWRWWLRMAPARPKKAKPKKKVRRRK